MKIGKVAFGELLFSVFAKRSRKKEIKKKGNLVEKVAYANWDYIGENAQLSPEAILCQNLWKPLLGNAVMSSENVQKPTQKKRSLPKTGPRERPPTLPHPAYTNGILPKPFPNSFHHLFVTTHVPPSSCPISSFRDIVVCVVFEDFSEKVARNGFL